LYGTPLKKDTNVYHPLQKNSDSGCNILRGKSLFHTTLSSVENLRQDKEIHLVILALHILNSKVAKYESKQN
jgi:hypothetical protein